ANVVMLNYKGELYSLRSAQQKNDVIISEKQKDNNEQKVIINDLSSYERVKKIAETMGMKTQKDNIKVVR
ncbi:MAG: cell division protein FtsL, partial [Gemella morbillorum]|nr:cell division protein FtsL [Gemella morbillorum]